jgi:hypothetical protein
MEDEGGAKEVEDERRGGGNRNALPAADNAADDGDESHGKHDFEEDIKHE